MKRVHCAKVLTVLLSLLAGLTECSPQRRVEDSETSMLMAEVELDLFRINLVLQGDSGTAGGLRERVLAEANKRFALGGWLRSAQRLDAKLLGKNADDFFFVNNESQAKGMAPGTLVFRGFRLTSMTSLVPAMSIDSKYQVDLTEVRKGS